MALPTYQATGSAISAVGTVTWPTHQAGDIAFLIAECTGSQTVTLATANGFASVDSQVADPGSLAGTALFIWWCRATSSSMANPVISGAANHTWARIVTVRGGIQTGNPWSQKAFTIKGTASTTTSFPTVTTTVDETLMLLIASRETDDASAAWSAFTNADLSNLSEHVDDGTITGNGGGMVVATGEKATAGATGATTATVTSSKNVSFTLAIQRANLPPTVALNTADATSFGSDTTPTVNFTGTDQDADTIEYNVQIDSVNTFDSQVGTPTTDTITATGTWEAPAGVTSVDVELWGGGGGGAGEDGTVGGGGGAGGGYSKSTVSVTPGTSYEVTIGAGGAGGGNGAVGVTGGDTWFDSAATVMAKGGQGGRLGEVASTGGASASGVGTTKTSGGNGGAGGSENGGGGGGSGGTGGNGGAGATGNGGSAAGGTAGSGTGGTAGVAGGTGSANGSALT